MGSYSNDNRRYPKSAALIAALILAPLAVAAVVIGWIGYAPPSPVVKTSDEPADPGRVLYSLKDTVKTGLADPVAIAIGPDDALYVAGDDRIVVFDRGTDEPRATFSLAPLYQPITALAVDVDGQMVLGFRDHVELMAPDGASRESFYGLGARAYITSVSVRGNRVWVADAGNRQIVRYDKRGQVEAVVGGKPAAGESPVFVIPSPYMDVVATDDGGVWVANTGRHRLELYGPDKQLVRHWGTFGAGSERFCGCCNPSEFAILPDGRFVTAEKGIPRVKIYSAHGEFEGFVALPKDLPEAAVGLDLATDSNGQVYVLEPESGSVRVYARK